MIHFSCMYCGKRIRAKAKLVGRKAPCPACGHALVIPKPPPAGQDAAPSAPPSVTPAMAKAWEGKSNKEVAKLLLRNKTLTAADRGHAATKKAMSPLLPRYDELTLFALSVTFLLLLAISPQMQRELPKAALLVRDGRIFIILGLAVIGMVFSLFGIFFRRPKPDLVKWPMLVFAVVVTAGTGIYAGYVTLKTARGWLMVFPAWNVVNGALLLLLFRAGLLDPDCILDRAAKFLQVVLTVICVGILLAVCQYGFKLHWAITYSVCVGYTMSLHHGLADIFGGIDTERG
jgi:DNA-directed RNA polymerase subunit RPC12/RpoP